jgi:hypothetical protein
MRKSNGALDRPKPRGRKLEANHAASFRRNWNLSMPSFLMRYSNVGCGRLSRLAAPFGPETRPCDARYAASIASRSRASSCPLNSCGAAGPVSDCDLLGDLGE